MERLTPPLPFRPLSRRSGRIPTLPYPPLSCFQSGPTATSSAIALQRTAITLLALCLTPGVHFIFQCAERWELIDKNPIKLVRVKGGTKRLKTPRVLAPERFHSLLPLIREPFRTMVLIAGCLGLRVSEIVALQWQDFDFPGLTLLIQRSVVHGRVGDVKTEYSRDSVPLDTAVVEFLMVHKERSFSTPEGWLFANPMTGRPYHQEEIQKKHIRKAGATAGIGDIGWHTFRHSYRSWLDETGAPITVQKELMRHASIQTTMNVYGRAMTDSKSQAHSNVVQMVLNSSKSEETAGQDKPGCCYWELREFLRFRSANPCN